MFKFLRKTLLYIVLAPYAVGLLGAASNQAVLYANNDTFPVRMNPVKLMNWSHDGADLKPIPPIPGFYPNDVLMMDDVHCLMTPKTHLNWLADNFDFHTSIMSIGDLMLDFGTWASTFTPFLWGGAILRKLTVE